MEIIMNIYLGREGLFDDTKPTLREEEFNNLSNNFEDTVHKFYDNLLLEQKSLPNDVLQIMNKNMDYLYKPVPL
jgi:hypothetical protein